MKTTNRSLVLLALLSSVASADDVTEQKTWTQRYPVSSATPRLVVDNIWGSVRVRAGTTPEIVVTVSERRTAPDEEAFQLSQEIITLDVQADTDGVVLTVGDPERRERRVRCRGCRVEYQFDIVVPRGTRIDANTVNDGRIDVAAAGARVSASNVNGPVAITDLHECASIESVNGEVELAFVQAPSTDCRIETINGEITVVLPEGAGLTAALDIINGRVTSDFDLEPLALPAKIEKQEHNGRFGYRIKQLAGVRVGAGGPTFSIASLNGDVRIRKTQ
jgi:hypothetical protein